MICSYCKSFAAVFLALVCCVGTSSATWSDGNIHTAPLGGRSARRSATVVQLLAEAGATAACVPFNPTILPTTSVNNYIQNDVNTFCAALPATPCNNLSHKGVPQLNHSCGDKFAPMPVAPAAGACTSVSVALGGLYVCPPAGGVFLCGGNNIAVNAGDCMVINNAASTWLINVPNRTKVTDPAARAGCNAAGAALGVDNAFPPAK